MNPFDSRIPESTRDGLIRYIDERIPTGGFLRAVLENDLREAAVRADLENASALVFIALWLYYNAPRECWGSPQRVEAWLSRREVRAPALYLPPDWTAERRADSPTPGAVWELKNAGQHVGWFIGLPDAIKYARSVDGLE